MIEAGRLAIDGSQGEGGGQIVRSSLALSMVTGRAVEITNIRAGRDKPGLMRQHLTAVRAAAEICDAEVIGDEIGSRSLQFDRKVQAGDYSFAVGTAGSATLVLQTVLPRCWWRPVNRTWCLKGEHTTPGPRRYDFLREGVFAASESHGPAGDGHSRTLRFLSGRWRSVQRFNSTLPS